MLTSVEVEAKGDASAKNGINAEMACHGMTLLYVSILPQGIYCLYSMPTSRIVLLLLLLFLMFLLELRFSSRECINVQRPIKWWSAFDDFWPSRETLGLGKVKRIRGWVNHRRERLLDQRCWRRRITAGRWRHYRCRTLFSVHHWTVTVIRTCENRRKKIIGNQNNNKKKTINLLESAVILLA